MPTVFTLSIEQYESLIALAQQGTYTADGVPDQQKMLVLEAALQDIEKSNGVVRYSLWVQWQNPNAPLPPGVNFPATWPPEMRYFIQFISRPVSKADVLGIVKQRAPNAVNILVTPDPAALLGWTPLDSYFVQP